MRHSNKSDDNKNGSGWVNNFRQCELKLYIFIVVKQYYKDKVYTKEVQEKAIDKVIVWHSKAK